MKDIMFFHGKTTDNRRFTTAGTIIKDELHLGLSLCSERDIFIKAKGRAKAEGRMKSNWTIIPGEDTDNYQPKGKQIYTFKDEIVPTSFINSVSHFNKLSSKVLQKEFNLYHNKV